MEDLVEGTGGALTTIAASIIAKVTRDRLLVELDAQYPQYGFAAHKGYGVSTHVEAILRDGPCPWHRGSYEPIKTHFPQHQGISEEKTLVLK